MRPCMNRNLSLCLAVAGMSISQLSVRAVDFHVTTAQDLQNALTLAAANGAPDTIWLAAGYYVGNFNCSSAEDASLTLRPEPGVDATQVTIDGAGNGRSMNLACSAAANITVTNLTFLRNCGSDANAALRISTVGADVSVGGCRFLGSTNHAGIGVELVSGRNATVRNCTVSRTGTATGGGIITSEITAELRVEGNVVSGTGAYNSGRGIDVTVSAQGVIWITGNTVRSNSYGSYGGGMYSSGTVTISGNTVTENYAGSGGGMYSSGTATISGNTVTGNYAGAGGGMYSSGTATISGNTVTGNSASQHGGGIVSVGAATISGNTVTGNSASQHGGGIVSVGAATISGNTVTGNSASQHGGGGIYSSGTPTIIGNTVTGNSADGYGGGIYADASSGTLSLSGNLVLRNRVAGTGSGSGGGGIYASAPTLKLFNNVVAGNTAPSGTTGGGLWLNPRTQMELLNNTVTGNSGGNGGGAAISITGVTEQLYAYNNILWGNSATGNGKDVWLAGTGQRKEFLYNDAHDLYGVWDIAVNNIDLAPQFFDPVNGDYHIQGTSPCKDAGTNATGLLPDTDLDGGPRIANGTVDLGCYEYSTAATHPADADTNYVMTAAEFAGYAAAWKAGQTWSNAPTVIPADYVTRAGYLMTNGGTYHNDGSARPVNWKTGP